MNGRDTERHRLSVAPQAIEIPRATIAKNKGGVMQISDEALGVIETRSFYDPIPATALVSSAKHHQSALVRTIPLVDVDLGVVGEAEEIEVDAFAAGVFEPPSKHARLEVLRVLGSRMREALELCRFTQSAAARQLGCETSRLARIESATHISSVPLWLIRRAAERYEVGLGICWARMAPTSGRSATA